MQAESPEKIRNLAVAGHSDTGKTTLVSSLLCASGVVNRISKIEDGNTTTDFDPQEISAHAERFSEESFRVQILNAAEELVGKKN